MRQRIYDDIYIYLTDLDQMDRIYKKVDCTGNAGTILEHQLEPVRKSMLRHSYSIVAWNMSGAAERLSRRGTWENSALPCCMAMGT